MWKCKYQFKIYFQDKLRVIKYIQSKKKKEHTFWDQQKILGYQDQKQEYKPPLMAFWEQNL